MTVKELKAILDKLPDDTSVCKADGESGCSDLKEARYYPEYSILYLEPHWERSFKKRDHFNMRSLPNFGEDSAEDALSDVWSLAHSAKLLVDAKNDKKMHRIQILQDIDNPRRRMAVIDEKERFGSEVRYAKHLLEFEWESRGLPLL